MLTRLYADNFLCLVNFELTLGETNILLGPNGSGKTSVLRVLRIVQALVSSGSKLDEVLTTKDLTSFETRDIQHFQLELQLDSGVYCYDLYVEHDREKHRMRVSEEHLQHDNRPIFGFKEGDIQLYRDNYSSGPTFSFDWNRSGLGAMHDRDENQKLSHFKKAIANFIIVNPCPPLIKSEARAEDEILEPLMQNFVGWYRYTIQENMGEIAELFQILGKAIPGFDTLRLPESGENVRTLKARFNHPGAGNRSGDYSLDELSDGQRLLVALYSLLVLSGNHRASLFLDEPDNYLSPREIQPFLVELGERSGDTLEQAVIISHHPMTIDYMAGTCGRWFSRNEGGTVQAMKAPKKTVDGLPLSEQIARGWEQ